MPTQGPKPKEADLLRAVKQLLTLLQNQGRLAFTRIHTMPVMRGGRMSINRDMAGFADIEIVCNGAVGYIELKSPSGTLSKAQSEFLSIRKEHGAKVLVARTIDQVHEFLEQEMQVGYRSFTRDSG